jgi:hypothetical protein
VADEAFLRRIGYKIHVGEVSRDNYRRIMRDACEAFGVRYAEEAFEHLLVHFHERHATPLLACYPRDLVRQIADYARYIGHPPELNAAMLDWAWHNYFAMPHGLALDTLEQTS